jgi:hypothetical protein
MSDVSAAVLPVCHGTRRSSAEAILLHGFKPTSVAEQVAAVAREYELPLERLRSHLQRMGRFAHLDERSGTVSLTASPDRAGSWANRAPEATWEALWSVYALLHPELSDEYYQSDEGHFWVMAQQIADPPAVVVGAAPLAALTSWSFSRGKTAPEILERTVSQGGSAEDFVKIYMRIPEWRADAEHVIFGRIQPTPMRLERHVVAFMADEDPEVFHERLRTGAWGQPEGEDQVGMPFWSFEEVWRRLPPHRRAQLEDIAGRDLSARD